MYFSNQDPLLAHLIGAFVACLLMPGLLLLAVVNPLIIGLGNALGGGSCPLSLKAIRHGRRFRWRLVSLLGSLVVRRFVLLSMMRLG